MASATLDRFRFTWFASAAGTAASYLVLGTLAEVLQPAADSERLILFIFSAIVGGNVAAYVSRLPRLLPCLVIALTATLQLYDPIFGPGWLRPLSVYSATVTAGFVASYFGHTFSALNDKVSPEPEQHRVMR